MTPPALRPRVAIAALCAGGFAASVTQTMVIPLQSELPRLLSTSAAHAGWVVTVTLLAGAVAMPIAGRLADMYGKQVVLAACAGTLVAGSVVCAWASTLGPMLAGRALQGLAMGFIPVGISLIRQIAAPGQAATAIAAMSATLGVGGALGLPLSAWIAQTGDWHHMFWLTAALAAVVLLLTLTVVPRHRPDHAPHFDAVGALGLGVGLVAVLIGITRATSWGWLDARTVGTLVAGVLVLLAWGWYELRADEPLVDLRSSARLPVLMTNLAAVAVGFGMMASSIVVPQLLQLPAWTGHGLDQSLLATGLWLAPAGMMMMLFSPVSGRLIDRLGPRIALMIGGAVLGAGYLAALVMMSAPWQLLVASCITAAGVGIGYAAMPSLIMDNVDPRAAAAAVGLNALMRSVGTTLAAAVMATVLTSRTVDHDGILLPSQGAFQACFLIGAGAAVLGVLLTAVIPRRAQASGAGADPVGESLALSR
ncbi:MFS transporter [Nocardioides limicola]|uniref:MFS transporter n=1 Tax=Nocardioides limicola TaxID=2803368 RepID=UPI00193B08C2|nr:MFS transporter [Nocardioides sp. DJM-14]